MNKNNSLEIPHRNKLAAHLPHRARILELGVAKGEFTEQLATLRPDCFIIGIDRWTDHHNEVERSYCTTRLKPFKNVILLKNTFEEAVSMFVGGEFDMIYIDGYAHTGQADGRTLRDWWPKLKRGGLFSGHDYCMRWAPTVEQVDKFMKDNSLSFKITHEKGPREFPSWYTWKNE